MNSMEQKRYPEASCVKSRVLKPTLSDDGNGRFEVKGFAGDVVRLQPSYQASAVRIPILHLKIGPSRKTINDVIGVFLSDILVT
jgi:hypothetical protein